MNRNLDRREREINSYRVKGIEEKLSEGNREGEEKRKGEGKE